MKPLILAVTRVAVLCAAMVASLGAGAQDLGKATKIVEDSCSVCHGADGESASPAFPRLAGQHAGYIERQLRDYKSGKRKSRAMSAIIEDVSEADFKSLGAYFQSRATHTHPIEDAELAQVGRFLYVRGNPYSGVPACSACHGENGHGTAALPRLAGQHTRYVERQLQAFDKRERTNDNAVMHAVASKLTELELRAVAAYVAGLK
jgi:cytochrome c553